MIAQLLLTMMLFTILLYSTMTYRQAPIIGLLTVAAAFCGLSSAEMVVHKTSMCQPEEEEGFPGLR
jgi:hypothetical protein